MKHLIFITLLLTALITACNTGSRNPEGNVALVENYIKAVENADAELMESLLAENYVGFGPSFGDSIGKAQALLNWKDNVENLYEKIRYNSSRNIAISITTGPNQGDWVSNWAELFIRYKQNQGSVTIWANTIYLIENNKIAKSYTFYNEADALRQLGYVIIDPNDL